MLPAITYEIISCGSQRSAIKDLTVRRLVRGRSHPSGFFSSTPIVQVCYGIIQPEDIPLPRIRMGDVRALSQEECDRLLRTIATNPSPFRKIRDRTIIVTVLLTGSDIGLINQRLVKPQRCRSKHSPVGRFCQDGSQRVFKTAEAQEPHKGVIHILLDPSHMVSP